METPLLSDEPSSKLLNLLLIDNVITDYQTLVDSVNESTLTIVYSYSMTTSELISEINKNFTTITRVGIICHSNGTEITTFLDNQPFFLDSETSPYSENLQFLIDAIKDFNVKNIDFLACNTLNYSNWKNNYEILTKETGVIVGASDDPTGNIKYGGDWIMENTNEDIENIYFKSNIQYYKYLFLAFTIGTLSINLIATPNPSALTSPAGIGSTLTTLVAAAVTTTNIALYRAVVTAPTVETHLTIPTQVTQVLNNQSYDYSIVSIGAYSFANINANTITLSNLTQITFPESITFIGTNAFQNLISLKKIHIPGNSTLVTLPTGSFSGCTNLTEVTGGNNIVTIGESAFSNCASLSSWSRLSSVTSIGNNAFLNCTKLSSITLATTVTSIGSFAFSGCPLTEITLPSNVTIIPSSTFSGTKISSLTIPSTVTSILAGAFSNCTNLTQVTFGHTIKLPFLPGTTWNSTPFDNSGNTTPLIAYYNYGVTNPGFLTSIAGFSDARTKTGSRFNSL